MNKKNKILIISFFLGTIFSILIIKYIDINCLFKKILGIPCPGCGLTRAFRALLDGQFLKALYYNYLVYPLIILYIIFLLIIIKDLTKKTNNFYSFLNKIAKYYKLIILLLIITEFINLIHGI